MQIVMYGRVGMLRDYCEYCERTALIIDGRLACCDRTANLNQSIKSLKREAVTFDVRRLNKYQREYILEKQERACFYCSKPFGIACFHYGREIKIKCNFDHIIPMAYQGDNSLPNIVAACQKCNAWKSDLIFTSLEEARLYLREKWENHRRAPVVKKPKRAKVVKYGVKTR